MTLTESIKNNNSLWEQWSKEKSVANKHALFDSYSHWMIHQAKIIYSKYNVSACEFNDYIHYASIALLESIERYNTDSNIPFELFAIKRLKGEVLDSVSKFTEKTNGYAQIRKMENTKFISLINKEKNNPTESLIELTIDLYLIELLEDQCFFDNTSGLLAPYHSLEFEQLKQDLLNIIDHSLSENEQIVIRYHYFFQWSFVEIAERLEMGRARVSQIHKQAIDKLKSKYFE